MGWSEARSIVNSSTSINNNITKIIYRPSLLPYYEIWRGGMGINNSANLSQLTLDISWVNNFSDVDPLSFYILYSYIMPVDGLSVLSWDKFNDEPYSLLGESSSGMVVDVASIIPLDGSMINFVLVSSPDYNNGVSPYEWPSNYGSLCLFLNKINYVVNW